MPRTNTPEMEAWVREWPIGSQGIFGGRVKERVKVVGVIWERGFPTLELNATTGRTYYCKYGMRRELSHIKETEVKMDDVAKLWRSGEAIMKK